MIMQLRRSRISAMLGILGALFAGGAVPSLDKTPTIQTETRRKPKHSKTPQKGLRSRRRDRGSPAEQLRRQADAGFKRAWRRMRNLELVQRGGLESSV